VIFSKLTKTLSVAILSAVAVSATAQDLIARQAPIDRRLKDVTNIHISSTMASTAMNANLNNPAADIYTDWNSKGVKNASGYAPARTKIDLRGFAMPTPSRKVTSPFGHRWGRLHAGLDIKVYVGDTIRAAFDGKVRIVDFNANGYGNYVVIRHPNGLETLYGHMSKHLVKSNQIVRAGEPIGLGGDTGRSFGSHLHFETRICGTPINPALMFDFPHQDVTADFFTTTASYGTHSAVAATTHRMTSEMNVEEEDDNTAETAVLASNTATETASTSTVVTPVKKQSTRSSRNSTRSTRQQRSRSYVVRSGDNLTTIARRNGTTVDALCRANGIKSTATIREGQKLKL